MNTQQLLSIHEQLSNESREIMEKKNHDYSGASGDPFANFRGAEFLGIHPVLGMQLRQQDKMMRVRTFVNKGQLAVKSESVKDAIIDQINYLVLQYAFIVASTEGENKNDESGSPYDIRNTATYHCPLGVYPTRSTVAEAAKDRKLADLACKEALRRIEQLPPGLYPW